MPGQPAAPAAEGGFFSMFGFIQRKQAGKPAFFLPCIGRRQEKAERPGPNRDRGQKKQARCKSGGSIRKLWFCCAGRQNCEAPKKSQKQAGGKAPERRRPLWTPSDGNAANGLFLIDFAAMLPCAHSAKGGRFAVCRGFRHIRIILPKVSKVVSAAAFFR